MSLDYCSLLIAGICFKCGAYFLNSISINSYMKITCFTRNHPIVFTSWCYPPRDYCSFDSWEALGKCVNPWMYHDLFWHNSFFLRAFKFWFTCIFNPFQKRGSLHSPTFSNQIGSLDAEMTSINRILGKGHRQHKRQQPWHLGM